MSKTREILQKWAVLAQNQNLILLKMEPDFTQNEVKICPNRSLILPKNSTFRRNIAGSADYAQMRRTMLN